MAHYDHQQAPGQVYPPPPPPAPESCPPPQNGQGPYVTAPPPIGYPTRDYSEYPQAHQPVENRSRGDDFWKGCFAGLCCCCVCDMCFC